MLQTTTTTTNTTILTTITITSYALVGFVQGAAVGLSNNFCFYSFHGDPNTCINATNIVNIPWNLKFFYAWCTDSYKPMGYRRRPYMVIGWVCVLIFTFILACISGKLQSNPNGAVIWILFGFLIQAFLILADVVADGFSVEIGSHELYHERGVVLITGQIIRFWCSIGAGFLQAFFMNGPDTNPSNCIIDASNCWSWGMDVSQFYWFSFFVVLVGLIPILYLKELVPSKDVVDHTFNEHIHLFWETLQNRTTYYMLIYACLGSTFAAMSSSASTLLQYEVLQLSNLQSGIDAITTNLTLLCGIFLFRKYLLNYNWRVTQYASSIILAIFGLLFLFAYNNVGGLLNAWFTIFINLSQAFAGGITQVLYGVTVIEIAKVGQEAITYELIISAHNAASTVSTAIATQFLGVTNSLPCTPSIDFPSTCLNSSVIGGPTSCASNTVNVNSICTFEGTGGPRKFSDNAWLIFGINIIGLLLFTQYLPSTKAECQEWKEKGETSTGFPTRRQTGFFSLILASFIIIYGVITSVALLDPKTACLPAFGGSGCY